MSSHRAPRAFTILEVTIVLAIATALAALSLPAMGRWLSDGKFRETCGRLEAGLEQCRAESLRRGSAVAAVCRARRDGSWVVVASVMEESRDPLAGASVGRSGDGVAGSLVGAASDQSATTEKLKERTVAVLEKGMLIARLAAPVSDLRSEEKSAEPNSEFMVAVFFPDGSAAGEPGTTIRDGHGRAMELRVNGWTGSVTMVKVAEESVGAERAAVDRPLDDGSSREPSSGRAP